MSLCLIYQEDLSNEIFEVWNSPIRHGFIPHGQIWFNIHGLALLAGVRSRLASVVTGGGSTPS
jgi:hypothetical protein